MVPGQGNKLLIKIYSNFAKPVDFFSFFNAYSIGEVQFIRKKVKYSNKGDSVPPIEKHLGLLVLINFFDE
jgi:hypothetical protein